MRKYSHLRKRGKRFPVLLQNREKSPNWVCLTAGSVGRGRLRLVSPYSAVPGFIRPLTNTRRRTWAKRPAWNRWDFLEHFSWLCCHRHNQSNTDQLFKARTSDTVAAQVCFGEFCLSLASAILHVWRAQALTTLAAFLQLRPLKLQPVQSAFPLHAT